MEIYLDHNATCPVDPEVFEEMRPFLETRFGNPSSIHRFGQSAKRGMDLARERVATLVGAEPEEVVFTSGGTEANNHAIFGIAQGTNKRRFVTSKVEHQAVLSPFEYLASRGAEVFRAEVDATCRVQMTSLTDVLTAETALVSIMTANNDVGTVQPIREIAAASHAEGILVHTDAVQAVGKIPVNVADLDVDMLSFSAHKIYGPKGIGALIVRRGVSLIPHLWGGHQESRKRAGTENVPAVVGFGKACALAMTRFDADVQHLTRLRDMLEAGLTARVPDCRVFGAGERLPGTLNVGFERIEGDTLMMALDLKGIAISTGSACMTETKTLSHVLTAMGVGPLLAKGSIRFSLGRENTEAEINTVIETTAAAVERLRSV